MFCKYCGRQIPDGSVCTCQQAQAARAQQAKNQGQTLNNQRQGQQPDNNGQNQAENGQPSQSQQMTGKWQQVNMNPQMHGDQPDNNNSQMRNGQPDNNNPQMHSGQPDNNNPQMRNAQPKQPNNGNPQANYGHQPNNYNYQNINGNPYMNNRQPNRAPMQDNAQKKDKFGMLMCMISLAVSVVGIIVFLLLRFVLADMLSGVAGNIYQYLIYIIPGILGIAGCVLAVFSLQSEKNRLVSIIAIALGAIVTIFVIVSMVIFPYEGKQHRQDSDNHDALIAEEESRADEADTEDTEAEATDDEGSAAVDAMLQNYQNSKDYAQAKQALDALDVSTLSSDDANRVIDFQDTIESDLKTEMQSYADTSDYTSLFSKLKTYEAALGEDSLLKEIRNTYEADYIVYLDEQTHALAEDGKKDEAIAMLDEAKNYLTDASVVDDMKETVEKLGSDYIIPDSDSRYLTRSELSKYTLQEINYAKNEIYARHGRQFASKELQDYFNSKSWYNGTVSPSSFSESVFNDYERKNIQTLKEEEFSRDSRGYQLDQ